MTGVLLRIGSSWPPNRDPHVCQPPHHIGLYQPDSVWRCVCGRRYTCAVVRVTNGYAKRWRRRRAPWPRRPA